MLLEGERQRNIDRRLRQLRKQLLKGDVAKLSAIQTQIAHRQAVSGGQHVIGKDQKQLFNAVEFMGVKVQAHQPLLRMETLFYPQIFNLLRGLFDPRQRVGMGEVGRAGNIQHAGNFSVRALDRHRGAIKILIAGEEVLAAVDFAAVVNGQRGTDGVGATPALAPQVSGSQREALRFLHRVHVAEGLQHQTAGIREDNHRLEIAHFARQGIHHRLGQLL